MSSESTVPRHGDPIVRQTTNAFGETEFPATSQFQRFIDELSTLVDMLDSVLLDELLQAVHADKSQFTSNISKLFALTSELDDRTNEIYAMKSLLEAIRINVDGVFVLASETSQQVEEIRAIAAKSSAGLMNAQNKIDDLEQMINVD